MRARIVPVLILLILEAIAPPTANFNPSTSPEQVKLAAGSAAQFTTGDKSISMVVGDPSILRDLTDGQKLLVARVTEQFALVGLDLPPVTLSFHTDTDPCGGISGVYEGDGITHRILVCVPDSNIFATQLHQRRTLVHEFAHAWEQANLDDADRSELLETLEADSWYGPESDWQDRGAERFAETVVWGLFDQMRRPTLIRLGCDELRRDFVAITGHAPLGLVEVACLA